MKKKKKPALPPHPGHDAQTDLLLASIPLTVMAVYMYGLRPLIMVVLAAITARLCDRLAARMLGRPFDKTETSTVAHAVLMTLLLPASASFYVVVFGVVAMAMVGKYALGGYGNAPFNLTALGYAIVAVSWPQQVFLYPRPQTMVPLMASVSGLGLVVSTSQTLKMGGVPQASLLDFLLGNYAGPMGGTYCLVLLACFVFILVRRRFTWHAPVSFMATCCLFALLFPRVYAIPRFTVMCYELLSGALVYAAVFMLSDTTTTPKNNLSKLIYGVLAGVLTMLYRYYGTYELGACFAVLLTGSLSGYIDRQVAHFSARRAAKKKEVARREA